MSMAATSGLPWYERPWFTRSLTVGFVLLILVKAVHAIFFKQNDFDHHLGWGREVFADTHGPQAGRLAMLLQYPPGRLLIDEGLALLPRLLARALVFAAAIGSLFVTWRVWRDLADAMRPAPPGIDLGAAGLAFLLLAPWVVRDFDECGLQILLLFFLTMAARAVWRGARLQAGAWLGLAVTYKVTPFLFVPLLLWKRRFVEAAATVGFVVAFNLVVPGLVWGPAVATDALVRHVELGLKIAMLADPSDNGIQPATWRSQSLTLAIARFLQTYPPGHPLFIDRDYDDNSCAQRPIPKSDPGWCPRHPLFVQFLDLPPATARRIVTAVLGLIALGLAWRLRRRWALAEDRAGASGRSALAPEWATACAFAALMSPLAWLQHLALALPCAYLVIRDALLCEGRRWPRWALLGIVFVCTWVLQRDPLSKQLALIAMSYRDDVLAVLLLVVASLASEGAVSRGSRSAGQAVAPPVSTSESSR